ncbi:HAMP domain-containing protein, partial [Bosea sp. BH3]|uniref:HAMP domain-containing protein n=1 Tax=Bosea sp. BH3 TaxID=2871701 RepID=UPI0029169BD3
MKSIGTKIVGQIAIVAVGALIAMGCALLAISRMESMYGHSSDQNNIALFTERLNVAVNQVVADSLQVYSARNPHDAGNAAATVEAGLKRVDDRIKGLVRIAPESERERMDKIGKLIGEFVTIRTETVRLAREVSGRAADVWGNSEASRKSRAALQEELTAFSSLNEKRADAAEADTVSFAAQVRTFLPLALIVLLGVAITGALVFSRRSIVRPMTDLSLVMERLTKGDTSVTVPHTKRGDEIGIMARSVAVLRSAIEQVAELQEQERAAAATRLARAQSIEAVVSDVGEVVAAAAAGDFSARLEIKDADEQMQRLVAGINEINAVVDSATTEFAGTLSAIAGGDLTNRVETAYRGKFADLKGAINETVDRLSETVSTIQTTSADVGLAAREINMGADDLSKRTEEQASSLEETAATTEELA